MATSVKAEIEKLRDELRRHNRLYFVEAKPEITDLEYDRLMARLVKLEAEHPEFDAPDSPSKQVGGTPVEGFETVEHKVPMLSIDNVYEEPASTSSTREFANSSTASRSSTRSSTRSTEWR